MIEISSRIHFWGLEGPEMTKIDLKQRFLIKVDFRGGRPLYAYPGLLTAMAAAMASAVAIGQARSSPAWLRYENQHLLQNFVLYHFQ